MNFLEHNHKLIISETIEGNYYEQGFLKSNFNIEPNKKILETDISVFKINKYDK